VYKGAFFKASNRLQEVEGELLHTHSLQKKYKQKKTRCERTKSNLRIANATVLVLERERQFIARDRDKLQYQLGCARANTFEFEQKCSPPPCAQSIFFSQEGLISHQDAAVAETLLEKSMGKGEAGKSERRKSRLRLAETLKKRIVEDKLILQHDSSLSDGGSPTFHRMPPRHPQLDQKQGNNKRTSSCPRRAMDRSQSSTSCSSLTSARPQWRGSGAGTWKPIVHPKAIGAESQALPRRKLTRHRNFHSSVKHGVPSVQSPKDERAPSALTMVERLALGLVDHREHEGDSGALALSHPARERGGDDWVFSPLPPCLQSPTVTPGKRKSTKHPNPNASCSHRNGIV
jgi:hypothetical protein